MGILRCQETQPGLILHRGPVIQVGISKPIAPQIKEGATEVQFEMYGALLDTGAGMNMISSELVKKLDPPFHSFTEFSSASHEKIRTKVYVIALCVPPPLMVTYDFVLVAESPLEFKHHQLIIGRPILKRWHITFDMGSGRYTICS
jgi:predicted aspartyl protease